MASIVWGDVTDLISGLPTVSVAGQTTILTHVNNALKESLFKTSKYPDPEDNPRLKLCRIYLAAHLATVGDQGASGSAGPVTSKREGEVQISYANPAGGMSFNSLNSTAYGKLYLSLLPPTTRGPFVV